MKKLLLFFILITYYVFSSSFIHAYFMGFFDRDISKMESHHISRVLSFGHNCCINNHSRSDKSILDNPCKIVLEASINSEQKIIKILKNIKINIISFVEKFSIYEEYIITNLNLPPPNVKREIKNYSYHTLMGIIVNIV